MKNKKKFSIEKDFMKYREKQMEIFSKDEKQEKFNIKKDFIKYREKLDGCLLY